MPFVITHCKNKSLLWVSLCTILLSAPSSNAAETPVNFFNLHTGEQMLVHTQWLPPPNALNHFFRCDRDRRYTLMDPRLVQLAAQAAEWFRRNNVHVLSAFRTRRYNTALRESGHGAALRSRHIHGQAMDFRIPGVPIDKLCRYFQQLHRGGVGCYLTNGFVHIDVGPNRRWQG